MYLLISINEIDYSHFVPSGIPAPVR